MAKSHKPSNSIRTWLFFRLPKRDFVRRFPLNSTQTSSSWNGGLYSLDSLLQERELTAELVSKIPWSEARDVWLKLGLLSVCHPDLTRGELFVGCVLSACLCLRALCSAVTGDEPLLCSCRWQGTLFVVKSWWSLHMKTFQWSCSSCCSSVLSVSLWGSQRLKLHGWYLDTRSPFLTLSSAPRFLLSGFILCCVATSLSLSLSDHLFSALLTHPSSHPSLVPLLAYRSELCLWRKIQVKPLSFQTAW